jgi:hypothetical protein
MFLIDVLGFEYDDAAEPFVLTDDGAHYTHAGSRKMYSRASIDALTGEIAAPKVETPIVTSKPAPIPVVEDDED